MKAIKNVGGTILAAALAAICLLVLSAPAHAIPGAPAPQLQVTLTIDPASVSLTAGAKRTFIATTHGGNNTGITWSATCGSFTSNGWHGSYTAPAVAGPCTVTGRLKADPTVSATAVVTVTGAATAALSITTQPANRTVTAGQTAAFSVTATGTALSYQWRKNGAVIGGATSSSYTTPATATADSGAQFTVVVSNSSGSVTSSAATLTVNAVSTSQMTLTVDPASVSLATGATQTFIATTHGGNNTGITWSASCGSFTSDGWYGFYTAPAAASSCAVTGRLTANPAVTVSAAVTVTGAAAGMPSITTQPANRTVTSGQTAAFSVTATGTTLSYQWRKNGAAISGATSSSYTTPATAMSDSGAQFTCVASNSAGSVASSAATLTVTTANVAPSVTTQPANRTVTAGQTAAFSVTVSGTAPFTYQWMKNGAAISGAASSGYTTPATTISDNGAQFSVVVTNSIGSVTSNPATLTVNAGTFLLSMNPASLSFGNVNLGASGSQSVTLTNSGTAGLTISGVSSSGPGFSVGGVSSGQMLSPGQAATLNVNFTPSAAGSVTGTVTVASNSTNSPATVSLSGSGVQLVTHRTLLSWSPSTSSVVGYQVYSSTVSGGPYTRLTPSAVNVPSYTDTTVQNGRTYYYVVTAVNAGSTESLYSSQAAAVIPQ